MVPPQSRNAHTIKLPQKQ